MAKLDTPYLFDCSSNGKLLVGGPDAGRFLHNLCTNDILRLPLNRGCLAYFCDRLAKVQGQSRIYHIKMGGKPAYWLDCPPGTNEDLLRHLDKHLISEQVEFENLTAEFGQIHLTGETVDGLIANEEFFHESELTIPFENREIDVRQPYPLWLRRNDLLKEGDCDLVLPKAHTEELKKYILNYHLHRFTLGSPEQFEMLRVEAGTPYFGKDIDDKRFVMEVGDAVQAVSYSKGCYLGQEPIVMARDRAGHINRAMKIVKALDGKIVPMKANLLREGKNVGVTTSSVVQSEKYGASISLAYIQRGYQELGTIFEADGADGKIRLGLVA